jgi:cell division transport system ATP-binding protein
MRIWSSSCGRWGSAEGNPQADSLCAAAGGLEEKANSFPTELSGGEQQRVAIARALVNNPDTIIADEPTGNLDPERSLELMSLLVKINQLGTTVVVVTHEKDLVDRFGKRVVTIESGHVTSDGVGGYVGGHIHG